METQGLVPCIDQPLGDCDYRRVGERRLLEEMPSGSYLRSIQEEADVLP